jgi:hypothetical protein
LALYPASFRRGYADEMTRLFEDQLRDARRAGSTGAVLGLWARSLVDVMVVAFRHRLSGEESVPRTAGPGFVGIGAPPPGSSLRPRVFVGLAPVWLLTVLAVAKPGYFDPIGDNPPGIAGVPAGVVMLGLSMVWMLIGVVILRFRPTSLVAAGTLLTFTIPSSLVVALGPTIVLIVQNF